MRKGISILSLFAAIALVSFAESTPASADSRIQLSCSTSGSGLALMEVVQTGRGTGLIRITVSEADDAPVQEFVIQSGLKDLMAGTSATLIAQKSGAVYAGGTYEQAILLRVLDGQGSARLAMDGNVHLLQCQGS